MYPSFSNKSSPVKFIFLLKTVIIWSCYHELAISSNCNIVPINKTEAWGSCIQSKNVSIHIVTSLCYNVFKNHRDVAFGFFHDISIKAWTLPVYNGHYKGYIWNKISVDFVNLSYCWLNWLNKTSSIFESVVSINRILSVFRRYCFQISMSQ